MVRLGDVCDIQAGGTPSRSNPNYWKNGNIPWVKIGDMGGKNVNSASEFITEEGIKNSSAKLFPAGIILFTIFATLGEVSILKTASATNQAIAGISPISKKNIEVEFLYFYLLSIKKHVISTGRGVAQNNINLSILRNIEIPLPPLEVQRKIAETLDAASELLAMRKNQLAELDKLIQSVFYDMFGDPVVNSMNWIKEKLNLYIEFLTSGSRGWSSYFSDCGEMFLTIKNVKNNTIFLGNIQFVNAPNTQEATRTKVQEGDLLISITADLGRTGVVTQHIAEYGAYINQHLSLIRLKRDLLNPIYASFFFESEGGKTQFESKNQVGVKSGLNFDAIKSLEILVPPIENQTQFAETVQKIEEQKALVQKAIDETQALFDSLMNEYFE